MKQTSFCVAGIKMGEKSYRLALKWQNKSFYLSYEFEFLV